MELWEEHSAADAANEQWLKKQYDKAMKKDLGKACLVTVKLKNFSDYYHDLGAEKKEAMIQLSYKLMCECLQEGEFAVRVHSCYFNLLLRCPAIEDAVHARAHALHFAVRDGMAAQYGRKLYLEMGFYPMMQAGVDFYSAQYLADACRKRTQRQFPETNYDIYYLCYHDQRQDFAQYEAMVQPALANGDFKLYLQPKVNLRTGEVTAGEALMRWIDPVLGMIPLTSFLPNLEENGMIREVDLCLFEEGCRYLHKWRKQYGKDISISFNMSKAYFDGPYFMPEYTAVFEQYDILPQSIRVELLESVVLNDMDRLQPLVKSIYDYGFSCALDDFGSGFSSFDILTNVALTELKIDRALFKDVTNERERILVSHIMKIAHALHLEVVAEGIETKEYAAYLKEIGCDFIQGYYYYKPMPIDEFEAKFVLPVA